MFHFSSALTVQDWYSNLLLVHMCKSYPTMSQILWYSIGSFSCWHIEKSLYFVDMLLAYLIVCISRIIKIVNWPTGISDNRFSIFSFFFIIDERKKMFIEAFKVTAMFFFSCRPFLIIVLIGTNHHQLPCCDKLFIRASCGINVVSL